MHSYTLVAAAFVLISTAAPAQESVTFTPPAPRPLTRLAHGELTAFLPDGGCTCQPESSVPSRPTACNGASCTASRLRTRVALLSAMDGGALDNP